MKSEVNLTEGSIAKNIIKFAKENNVLPGIVVGRLQNDKVISWNEFNDLIIKI